MSMPDMDRRGSPVSLDALALVGVLVLAVLAMLFLSSARQQELRRAPSGFDGLSLWLAEAGLDAQPFGGGWTIPAEEIGLNIIPVYDTGLDAERNRPTTKEELILQRDENDLQTRTLREKADMAPTMLVLPKWRTGMRLTGLAHPALLIDGRHTATIPADVLRAPQRGTIRHVNRPFLDLDYEASDGRRLTGRLYVAQVLEGFGCTPIIGNAQAMVLGRCTMTVGNDAVTVHVLADPDLLSNHGLRLGDNAEIARDVIATLAANQRVLIDYSESNWLIEDRAYDHPDRTWADLARFFAYPFSLLWLAAWFTMALFLWRGSFRFGPIEPDPETQLGASKQVMIEARARLMRLSGQDGALLGAYARSRIETLAHGLFGIGAASRDEAALLRLAGRRDPVLRQRLEAVLGDIRQAPASLPSETAIGLVDELELLLEQLSDDT